MFTASAYLKPIHPYAYRSPAGVGQVIGVVICTPDGNSDPRPCVQVMYPDGLVDYTPLSEIENGNYKICSYEEAANVEQEKD
jgi:hypothetical protein